MRSKKSISRRQKPALSAPSPRTVLVVEPCADIRDQMVGQLRMAGYIVSATDDGEHGLALCHSLHPDLVLCSLRTTTLSGMDFCARFRSLDRAERGYLILLAEHQDGSDVASGMAAGADDFLSLPLSPPKLLARLSIADRVMRIEDDLRRTNESLRGALQHQQQTQNAIERDLREAQKLQQGLVRERSGQFGSMRISLLLRPAGHVGGDLVGFFPIDDQRFGFYALDVSGHGVTAALLAAQLSVHLSNSSDHNVAIRAAQSGGPQVNPVGLASFFNHMMLEEMATDRYFTMIYGELNHITGHLRIVQAGHPHPMLQRADGAILPLGDGGMPIGLVEKPFFGEIDMMLEPGDRLLIVSDGITESENPAGRMLGEEGVTAILRTNAFLGGQSFLESMEWSVSEYGRGAQQDDRSAVLVEYLEPPVLLRP